MPWRLTRSDPDSGNSVQGPSQQGTALAPLQLWLLHVAFRKLKVGERWGIDLVAN